MVLADCAVCRKKILTHQPRWVHPMSGDKVCMECIDLMVEQRLQLIVKDDVASSFAKPSHHSESGK